MVSAATKSALAPVEIGPGEENAAQPSRSMSLSSAHSVPRSAERSAPGNPAAAA
jgi:hypothetical protein